ncbi:MAG TPA: dihydropteroate synthase [Candidatus Angelobacter sp.]|nr:dihydropteroate synthase [Candidatus Angelobacter sp.]
MSRLPRPSYAWRLRSRTLDLGPRTLIMGILNVTPDSFSDGGKYFARERAVEHGLQMIAEGADILDLGGESTRPGVGTQERGVPEEEELKRIMPVLEDILREKPDAIISADTYKAGVARAAVRAGAEIVNDVSALRWDGKMAEALTELQCGVILMHTRGRPDEWRNQPASSDIAAEVKSELKIWSEDGIKQGIQRDRVLLDAGFGFGKIFGQNYPLLAGLHRLHDLGLPLLSGTSRKSFIGRALAREGKDAPPSERLYGSLAAMTASILQGVHIVRVHEVKPAVEAAKVADEVLKAMIDPGR